MFFFLFFFSFLKIVYVLKHAFKDLSRITAECLSVYFVI